MPHLGEISVNVRLADPKRPRSVEDLAKLVAALRTFRGQPSLELDGTIRISFNSVQFMPNCINIGFLDSVPWDVNAQALNFTRYGICLPPDSVDELHSYGFPHRIRSDCELTHFFEHVWYVLKRGGTCHFRATNLLELMRRCLEAKDHDNDLHVIERQLFTGQDNSGLYFNQACLNKSRLISRMRHAGFLRVDVAEDKAPDTAALPKEPDQIWLREFTPLQMSKCLGGKVCIMSGCNGRRTNKPYRPTEFSIYCKRHFRKANFTFVTELNKRLAVQWASTKPESGPREQSKGGGEACLIPELKRETTIWRGARASIGSINIPVSLTGSGALCSVESLAAMVAAVREYRCLPQCGDGFRVSFNSDRFVPDCVNISNLSPAWEPDVWASKFDFAKDTLPLPGGSVDEFRCHGYLQRLGTEALRGFMRGAHTALRPYGLFRGTVNNLSNAKARLLEASGISDPIIMDACLAAPPLTLANLKATLESVGFAVREIKVGGGKYKSTEDVVLPKMDGGRAERMRFSTGGGEDCCIDGCDRPRNHPKGRQAPSIYCRRHYRHAARAVYEDILEKATVHFEAVKKYRVEGRRRIRISGG